MNPDLYARLGLEHDALTVDIHRAWRIGMRRSHPDLARDEVDRIHRELASRLLNEAYWTLGDPVRRAEYDSENAPRFSFHRPAFLRRRPAPALHFEVRRRLADFGPGTGNLARIGQMLRASAIGFFADTRGGQWLLVGLLALVPGLLLPAPLGISAGFMVAGLVSIRLARDGSPTPLADATAIWAAIAAFGRALTTGRTSSSGGGS